MNLLILLALLFPRMATALEVTALGGLNFAAPTHRASNAEVRWTGEAALSYGLAAALPVFLLPFDVELGVFKIAEHSTRESPAATRRTHMTQVPLVVRFNFDEHIGMGLGGYLGFGEQLAGENMNDAGLVANVRARFNLAPPIYFVLDARYQHGLTNRATAAGDLFNTRSVQGFAGVQYWFEL